jgi:hypothetical protein
MNTILNLLAVVVWLFFMILVLIEPDKFKSTMYFGVGQIYLIVMAIYTKIYSK